MTASYAGLVWFHHHVGQRRGRGSDDEPFIQATHRAFLLGYGKLGIVFLLGIFLPLFLATGSSAVR